MATATEFKVTLENRPGTLAELMEATGNAGVNIDGIQGAPCGGLGIIQMVTSDPDGAAAALDGAGVQYTSREVLVVSAVDEPGAGGRITRAMADAGINVDAFYVTMGSHVVLGVDDLGAAQGVADGMGIS